MYQFNFRPVVDSLDMLIYGAVADRVIFMDKGVIVEENAPAEFFGNPQNERLQNFLGQIA